MENKNTFESDKESEMELTPSQENALLSDDDTEKGTNNAVNTAAKNFAANWRGKSILKPSAFGNVNANNATGNAVVDATASTSSTGAANANSVNAGGRVANTKMSLSEFIGADANNSNGLPSAVLANLNSNSKSPTETNSKSVQQRLNTSAGKSSTGNSEDAEQKKEDVSKGETNKKSKRGGKKVREKKERLERRAQLRATQPNESDTGTQMSNSNVTNEQTGNNNAVTNVAIRQLQQGKAQKRSHIKGETPPDVTQAQKKGRIAPREQKKSQISRETLASAISDANLLVAIFDSPVPNIIVPLTKEKYDMLYLAIDNFVFESIEADTNNFIPSFELNQLAKGVMKLRCSTPATKAWLTNAVAFLPPLWADMSLKVINFDDLPEPKKVLGLFRNCRVTEDKIIRYLAAQNPRLNFECWQIVTCTKSDNGLHVVFSIPIDQLVALNGLDFRLCFGSGVAMFKDISKKHKGNTAQTDAEMEVDDASQTTHANENVSQEANETNEHSQMPLEQTSSTHSETPKTGKTDVEMKNSNPESSKD